MLKFYTVVSGSSGNCTVVSDNKTNVLIDCGLTGKRLAQGLSDVGIQPGNLNAILITHEHIDHISGAGVVSRRYNVPIFANEKTWQKMEGNLGKIQPENIRIFKSDMSFEIGTIGVTSFNIPHDSVHGVGYSLHLGSKKLSVATDMGCIEQSVIEHIKGSFAVVLESNHDVTMLKQGSYPYYLKKRILGDGGHLSNECAAKIAAKLVGSGTYSILLGHLSKENNLPEIAYKAVSEALEKIGARVDKDIKLAVADRYKATCAV